jgi:hypothetical protein
MSEGMVITNCVAECFHEPGPATCPFCKKPCPQDLADMFERVPPVNPEVPK